MHTTRPQNDNQLRQIAVKSAKEATGNDTNVLQEYVAITIIHSVYTPQGRRLVMRWYRHGQEMISQNRHSTYLQVLIGGAGMDNTQKPLTKTQQIIRTIIRLAKSLF